MTGVMEFEGATRECIHALKYEGRHGIATMMSRLIATRIVEFPLDVVIPVPLHASRRRERGYDQSALLARGVARSLDLVYDDGALRRVRRTRQQTTLDGRARRQNVAGAFEATMPLDDEIVLLIDDVITTGATMESAAGALKQAGASRVHGLAFAYANLGAPT
jgi:ComF family protein